MSAARSAVGRSAQNLGIELGLRRDMGWHQASRLIRSPCFSTTDNSFSAIPLQRLVPASHFCTVDSLVLRNRADMG